jgi:integrase
MVQSIPSLPGYAVSPTGDVWRLERLRSSLVPFRLDKYGSRIVTVRVGGKSVTRLVHRLVLEVFAGKCPSGCEARFLDGNRGNPSASNLAWLRREKTGAGDKPEKPFPAFPLYAHASGRWAKRIRGRTVYFGPWGDWKGALRAFERFAETGEVRSGPIHTAGEADRLTVKHLADRFYTDKMHLVDTGELTPRSLADYDATARRVVEFFGRDRLLRAITADDFLRFRALLAKTRNLTSLGNEITRVRILFNYAGPKKLGWLPHEVAFGPGFCKPSKKAMRIKRAAEPERLFTATEIQAAIRYAPPQLRAMIFLGINCGLGNTDCAELTLRRVDLASGWLTYPRPKTGVARRAKLWPETVAALRAAWDSRPGGLDDSLADRWFITRRRVAWAGKENTCPISHAFYMLLRKYWIHRPGLSFYTLRHTFQTIAEGSRDFPAIAMVMGHTDESMSARYRERIDDSRLETVAECVRTWLWN